jgi:hypothetical protein
MGITTGKQTTTLVTKIIPKYNINKYNLKLGQFADPRVMIPFMNHIFHYNENYPVQRQSLYYF